jgi:hypothetical protein
MEGMMSEYDYDDDGEEYEPMAAPTKEDVAGVTLTFPESVLGILVQNAAQHIESHLRSRVDKLVEKRLDAIMDEKFRDAIGALAEKAFLDHLAKPRRRTNSWGEEIGGAELSLSDLIPGMVNSHLEEAVKPDGTVVRDAYDRKGAVSRMQWMIGKIVRDQLDAETKAAATKVTEEAKKVVQNAVGRFIADQLVPQIDITKKS